MAARTTLLGVLALLGTLFVSSSSQAQVYYSQYSNPVYTGNYYYPATNYYSPGIVQTGFATPYYGSGYSLGFGNGLGLSFQSSNGYYPYSRYPSYYGSQYRGNNFYYGGGRGYNRGYRGRY